MPFELLSARLLPRRRLPVTFQYTPRRQVAGHFDASLQLPSRHDDYAMPLLAIRLMIII